MKGQTNWIDFTAHCYKHTWNLCGPSNRNTQMETQPTFLWNTILHLLHTFFLNSHIQFYVCTECVLALSMQIFTEM